VCVNVCTVQAKKTAVSDPEAARRLGNWSIGIAITGIVVTVVVVVVFFTI